MQRIGPQHQAGSDSLVTCQTFFRLMDVYFDNLIDDSIFSGVIYDLGNSTQLSMSSTMHHGSFHSLNHLLRIPQIGVLQPATQVGTQMSSMVRSVPTLSSVTTANEVVSSDQTAITPTNDNCNHSNEKPDNNNDDAQWQEERFVDYQEVSNLVEVVTGCFINIRS